MPSPGVICFQFTTSGWDPSQRRTALEQLRLFLHPAPLTCGGAISSVESSFLYGHGVFLFIPGGHRRHQRDFGDLYYEDERVEGPILTKKNADLRAGDTRTVGGISKRDWLCISPLSQVPSTDSKTSSAEWRRINFNRVCPIVRRRMSQLSL